MNQKIIEKFIKYWLPIFLWMTVIFIFSSYPTVKTSEVLWKEFMIKKSAHILEYGTLALLIFRALKNTGKYSQKKVSLISIFSAFFYGITDEYHQSYTSGREPTVRDTIFDLVGATIAVLFFANFVIKLKLKPVRDLIKLLDL